MIVSGPGGVGKDTLVNRLVTRDPKVSLSRSWTTRVQRPGEPDDAYRFVERNAFIARVADGGFLEHAEYLGNLYGTPWPDLSDDERDVVLVIEMAGAQQVLERHPEALMILVEPPSLEVQEARLRGRGDTEEHVQRRLAKGREEVEVGRRIARHVVVNDELDRAVEEVAGILRRYRTETEE